jgi:DNA-binding MarR family transcriptional regulator
MLFRAARLYNELAVARVQARAEPRFRIAHTSLFPHLDTEGRRLTELARRVGSSKQAVGPLVDDLVAWGVVERVPDPADRRAALVRLTARGGAALLDGLAVLAGIEGELRAALGAERTASLHANLLAVMDQLDAALAAPSPA